MLFVYIISAADTVTRVLRQCEADLSAAVAAATAAETWLNEMIGDVHLVASSYTRYKIRFGVYVMSKKTIGYYVESQHVVKITS